MGPLGPGGFRRRGRRRGLIVGAAVGASVAKSRANQDNQSTEVPAGGESGPDDTKGQLMQLQDLKDSNLITETEFQQKRKQILGV
jgi:hypothetical protein